MKPFDTKILKKLYIPPKDSHKGQNGKVLIVGGSKLFHAASLWALEAASRIVDMVYYSSVKENNDILIQAKQEFRNGIVVPRGKLDEYALEADCILIGPGLPRKEGQENQDDDTRELTKELLTDYRSKKWVIDGGALQEMEVSWIPTNAILTPHRKEYERLFQNKNVKIQISNKSRNIKDKQYEIQESAKKYKCVILLKGKKDIVCSPDECTVVTGGNAGMTKGGTGDVLAGLTAGLYAQNDDPYLVAQCASYFNKKAGELLYKDKGYWFNATDLLHAVPQVMSESLL